VPAAFGASASGTRPPRRLLQGPGVPAPAGGRIRSYRYSGPYHWLSPGKPLDRQLGNFQDAVGDLYPGEGIQLDCEQAGLDAAFIATAWELLGGAYGERAGRRLHGPLLHGRHQRTPVIDDLPAHIEWWLAWYGPARSRSSPPASPASRSCGSGVAAKKASRSRCCATAGRLEPDHRPGRPRPLLRPRARPCRRLSLRLRPPPQPFRPPSPPRGPSCPRRTTCPSVSARYSSRPPAPTVPRPAPSTSPTAAASSSAASTGPAPRPARCADELADARYQLHMAGYPAEAIDGPPTPSRSGVRLRPRSEPVGSRAVLVLTSPQGRASARSSAQSSRSRTSLRAGATAAKCAYASSTTQDERRQTPHSPARQPSSTASSPRTPGSHDEWTSSKPSSQRPASTALRWPGCGNRSGNCSPGRRDART
jgi:hypothetical protein